MPDKKGGRNQKSPLRPWSILVWIGLWQIAGMAVGQELLLASPAAVFMRLAGLIWESSFWASVWFSLCRILSGFFLAFCIGGLLAAFSMRFLRVRELLQPLLSVMKATPVASFIILALVWLPSRNLSVFISFLMVLPILYSALLEGLLSANPDLLEMAGLFEVSAPRRARYIYLSELMPFMRSACSVSLGLCWKAGIAAEVIGTPAGSIGQKLYQAKIYLETVDLFAWTVVIVLLSVLFERLFLWALKKVSAYLERA